MAVDGRKNPLGLNAEDAVKQLDARISDAIMYAMENGPVLEEKVSAIEGRSPSVRTVSAAPPVLHRAAEISTADFLPFFSSILARIFLRKGERGAGGIINK